MVSQAVTVTVRPTRDGPHIEACIAELIDTIIRYSTSGVCSKS